MAYPDTAPPKGAAQTLKLPGCVHVVPAITEEASGPSYSVVRLCEQLILLGHQVTLAVLDWAPMPTPPSFLKTFPLGLGPRRFGRSPAMKRWLSDQVIQGTVNLIHNHSLWMMPNVYPGHVARRHDVPYIVSPRGTLSEWAFGHGSRVKRIFWPILQKPALKVASYFHATSEGEYWDIRRLGFRQPVAIVPNGIDLPEWAPKPPQRDKRTLLFLGRIHRKKGLDVLLQAWSAVQGRFPEWNLLVVGPDNNGYLQEMKRLASQLKLVRCEFAGPLYGQQKWDAYRSADLFVLPTYSENFGIAVAEALASGTSAIVSKGAPWSGLSEHGAGWWIDIGEEPLIECLKEALTLSPDELAERGALGRIWIESDFSWRRVGEMMHKTYLWLLGGGSTPDWVRVDA
jgi:glycosyltransferase involved in cell wall biosynthesis